MSRYFQAFAYAFSIIIGGYLFVFTNDGHILKLCIACNSFTTILLAIVSIIIGVIGLSGALFSKDEPVNGRK